MAQAETKVRFDTKTQKERFMRAAKLRHWSLNRFMLYAAERMAELTEVRAQMPIVVEDEVTDKEGVTA